MEIVITSVSNVVLGVGDINLFVSLQGLFLDYNIFLKRN